MASGLGPNAEVMDAWDKLTSKELSWMIMGFDEEGKKAKAISLFASGGTGANKGQAKGGASDEDENTWFGEFMEEFKKYEKRGLWAGLFLNYCLADGDRKGTPAHKVLIFSFADDEVCNRFEKMMVGSTSNALKSKLVGFDVFREFNESGRISLPFLIDEASKDRTK